MPDLGGLYAESAQRIARQVYLVVQDEAIATAAVHDAFARAGDGGEHIPDNVPPESWVRAAALRLATGLRARLLLGYRRMRARQQAADRAATGEPEPAEADARLLDVLAELPLVQVTALVLHHLAGLDADDIAVETESTVGAAAARIEAAERALRQVLAEGGEPPGENDRDRIRRELAALAERAHLPLLPPADAQTLPERRTRRAIGLTSAGAAAVLLVLGLAGALGRPGAGLSPEAVAEARPAASATASAVPSVAAAEARGSSPTAPPTTTRPWLLPTRDSPPEVGYVPASGTDFGYVRGAFRYDGQVYVEFDRARLSGGEISNASRRLRVFPVAQNAFVEPGGRADTVPELLRLVVDGETADVPMRVRYDNGEVESFAELR